MGYIRVDLNPLVLVYYISNGLVGPMKLAVAMINQAYTDWIPYFKIT